jgi:predicted nucleotide-binding protein (sugar kinase/HSP70/actin superfamily)
MSMVPPTVQDSSAVPAMRLRPREDVEQEIRARLDEERRRLERQAWPGASVVEHFKKPVERPFTAADRGRVTVLFGGLTWKHERLIRGVFEADGYKVEVLPTPDVAAFQIGKEFGNNGQCNPTYFTVGHLVKYLQGLEARGLSRQQIVDDYVFVTAGSCGPCRFGMYEAEYRLAVENAGFKGFRILIIQQNNGMNAETPAPGLDLTTAFRLRTFTALNAGDVLNDVAYQIRPYERQAGETDRVLAAVTDRLGEALRQAPAPSGPPSRYPLVDALKTTYAHLYGPATTSAWAEAGEQLARIEVDRLRVKPIVKITGEFFAQTTEGDGNFHMFTFLEREGAQVQVEPVGNWIMYLLWCAKAEYRRTAAVQRAELPWRAPHRRLAFEAGVRGYTALFGFGERFFAHQYARVVKALGSVGHTLLDMDELAAVARPYYNEFARGGEGHLEVAKNIYYTVHKKAHMVLSLKPFGCMPSSQSDGVQSAVMNHFEDMIFLPIETSGEGEINAHSRVQMALGEAKAKARTEFQAAVERAGVTVDQVRAYVDAHPVLRHPFYQVPRSAGVIGTAANFVLHVSALMAGRAALRPLPGAAVRKRRAVPMPAPA